MKKIIDKISLKSKAIAVAFYTSGEAGSVIKLGTQIGTLNPC